MQINNPMTQSILDILNPVHILTPDEALKISGLYYVGKKPSVPLEHALVHTAFKVLQRYEELVLGKKVVEGHTTKYEVWQPALLKKEMFVSKEPHDFEVLANAKCSGWDYLPNCDTRYYDKVSYEAAQQDLIFEGFEMQEYEMPKVTSFKTLAVEVLFGDDWCRLFIDGWCVAEAPTMFDLLIEIDRYNRTASKPIELKFTPAFCDKLLSNG